MASGSSVERQFQEGEAGRCVGVRVRSECPARWGGEGARETGRRRGVAGHGEMGAPEVGDDPDRWAPPVGECVREGRERWAGGLSWAGRVWWADWREEKKGEELGRGPDGERKGVWGLFFFFFSNPF
jgi:hypothetical protein